MVTALQGVRQRDRAPAMNSTVLTANRWQYVGNNPTNATDPSGLAQIELLEGADAILNHPNPVPVVIDPKNPGKDLLKAPGFVEFKFDGGKRSGKVRVIDGANFLAVRDIVPRVKGNTIKAGQVATPNGWTMLFEDTSAQPKSDEFHWVQFARTARTYDGKDILFSDPMKPGERGAGWIATRNGFAQFGQDKWFVDTTVLNTKDPNAIFFDMLPGGVAVIRTKSQLGTVDKPTAMGSALPGADTVPQDKFDPKLYLSYVHYDTYLIWQHDGKSEVLFHVGLRKELRYDFLERVEPVSGKKFKTLAPRVTPWKVTVAEQTNQLGKDYNQPTIRGLSLAPGGKPLEYPNPLFKQK